MREILFRGKMDNGEWMYGSFCMDALEQFNGLCGVDGFIRLYDKAEGKMKTYEVDRETVGQYTGLKDKHGKRIFEGDIVKTSDITHEGVIQIPGESFEIAMRKGCWVMVAGEDWGFLETNHECIQVIGNIHGNQELQKGGEG